MKENFQASQPDRPINDVFLSIIIPAYNEAEQLPQTLNALRDSVEGLELKTEVIVVDNGSTDQTAKIAQQAGARLVREPKRQISRVRNAGAEQARGDWFLFLDADTHLSPALLRATIQQMNSGDYLAGGAQLEFRRHAPWYARLGLWCWNVLMKLLPLAAGSYFWVENKAFFQAGKFSEKVYASEEIWLALSLARKAWNQNKRFGLIVDPPAKTSARKFRRFNCLQSFLWFAKFILAPWLVFFRSACKKFWYD